MKRFWTRVDVVDRGIRLDDRPLRTPARAALVLPTDALTAAVAEEWRTVDGEIDPRMMPMTGFANAAIDRIAADPDRFSSDIAAYAATDLTCYRADAPPGLVSAQAAVWDPPLDWARARYDAAFVVTAGIMPVAQPPATIARLAAAVATYDAFVLAALQPLTTIGGSLVIALALVEGAMTAQDCWAAVDVDDRWQAERWGEDAEAVRNRAARQSAFLEAARFLDLLRD